MSRITPRVLIGVGDITEEQLMKNPPPWRVGECHETKANVVDANGSSICAISGGGFLFGSIYPEVLASLLVSALNGHLLPIYEKLVEQQRLEEKFHMRP